MNNCTQSEEEETQELETGSEVLPWISEKGLFNLIVLLFLIILFINRNGIIFDSKRFSPMPTRYSIQSINPNNEPVQINIVNETTKELRSKDVSGYLSQFIFNTGIEDVAYIDSTKPKEIIMYKTSDNKSTVKLLPMAYYSISGRTVAVNHFFGLFRNSFDKIALLDIGIVWGELSSKDVLNKHFKFQSKKDYLTGARGLSYELKSEVPLSADYINTHLSHTHVISAHPDIFAALLKLKEGDLVKMDGFLVDIFVNNSHMKGSLSRLDTNDSSRGGGACEIMYVTKVQIGNWVYE